MGDYTVASPPVASEDESDGFSSANDAEDDDDAIASNDEDDGDANSPLKYKTTLIPKLFPLFVLNDKR